MKRLAIAAAGLAALAALTATFRTGGAGAADPTPAAADRGITVQGTGTVSAEPDEAQLSLGVETREDTAEAALAANATRMRAVIAAVKREGAKDVETESVWPPVEYENRPAGYVATNTVTASIGIVGTGDLIDAATAAGANQVSGPTMTIDDEEALYRRALQAAVNQARGRAEVLADATGASLGRVLTVVEGGAAGQPPVFMGRAMAADSDAPIEPGERDVTAAYGHVRDRLTAHHAPLRPRQGSRPRRQGRQDLSPGLTPALDRVRARRSLPRDRRGLLRAGDAVRRGLRAHRRRADVPEAPER